jgi:UDP-N-acetyl-D-mannosaminuronic acid dehydrogenase
VFGVDKNERLLSALRDRSYSYTEAHLNEVLDEVLDKSLFVSDEITESDTYIVTVQTPVNEDHTSDNSYVERAFTELAPHIKDGDLVILESTVPIGSNKGFFELLRGAVGEGINFSYCYCPESILPGNIFHEIKNNSRVLGGMTPEAAERARAVYDIINVGKKELTDVATAEFVKLTQNAHRDVELAFVNQLSIMCDAEGVDPFRVIEIANRHPRCNLLYPGSGVGGHCIAVDPYFLIE